MERNLNDFRKRRKRTKKGRGIRTLLGRRERRKGKGSRHRGPTPKPILGIDAPIGDKEQNGK